MRTDKGLGHWGGCGPGPCPAAPPGMAETRRPWASMDERVRRTTGNMAGVRAGEADNHSLRYPLLHPRQSPPMRRKRHQRGPADKSNPCCPAKGGRPTAGRPSPPSVPTERAHGRAAAPVPSQLPMQRWSALCCAGVGFGHFGTVCGARCAGPWTTPKSPLIRSLWVGRSGTRIKHSNTEPLLPALPPHYNRLPLKLPSSLSCPLRG